MFYHLKILKKGKDGDFVEGNYLEVYFIMQWNQFLENF